MKELKAKVLDEIMQLMDEKEGEKLMKHPKLVAAKVSVAKPVEVEAEEEGEDEGEEMELPEGEIDLENIDPKMLKKMLAMLKK